MGKKVHFKLTFLLLTIFLSGCGFMDKDTNNNHQQVHQVVAPTEKPVVLEENKEDGLVINSLTGLLVYEEIALQRPVAIVINNIYKALPQSGISQADIYYEVLAEGGITRIIGIFKDFDSNKIGPIRSTRDYFAYFALEHDAVLVHHGGSIQGYNQISKFGINNLDGMVLEGSTFWRDPIRSRQPGMLEHSSYTSKQNIFTAMENKGFKTHVDTQQNSPFKFYDKPTAPEDGIAISGVNVHFSHTQISQFVYDEKTTSFKRYQNNKPHIDEETEAQLEVKNIIIQKVNKSPIPGDDAGRINIELIGEGGGYLITKGVYIPITWKKESSQSQTMWFDTNGHPLKINKGQTWICVFQKDGKIDFEKDVLLGESTTP